MFHQLTKLAHNGVCLFELSEKSSLVILQNGYFRLGTIQRIQSLPHPKLFLQFEILEFGRPEPSNLLFTLYFFEPNDVSLLTILFLNFPLFLLSQGFQFLHFLFGLFNVVHP